MVDNLRGGADTAKKTIGIRQNVVLGKVRIFEGCLRIFCVTFCQGFEILLSQFFGPSPHRGVLSQNFFFERCSPG